MVLFFCLYLLSQVHRLVVVDEQEVVKGIVSLSDILQALVLTNGDGDKGKHKPALCTDLDESNENNVNVIKFQLSPCEAMS